MSAGEDYTRWYHESGVWKLTTWHGIRTYKLPSDMWNYQEIIFERKIAHVIETGTAFGGSAVFFAETLAARGAPGPVISIDIQASPQRIRSCQGVHFLEGDSVSPAVVERAMGLLPAARGPLFLILDSDHARDHVLHELRAWVPRMRSGDYLVVEDTIVNGHPVRADHGPGPWEAVDAFLAEAPGMLIADAAREAKFGASFATHGHFIRA